MSKEWDKANIQKVVATVKKDEAEAFRKLAESKGTTPGALLRGFIRDNLSGDTKKESSGSVMFPVSYRNVDRINAEIAHHNPKRIPGNDMLDAILDRYFEIAAEMRK